MNYVNTGFGFGWGFGSGFGVGVLLGGAYHPWNAYNYWGNPVWWNNYAFYPRFGVWWHKGWGLWYYPWSYSWFNPDYHFWYYPRFGVTVHIDKSDREVYVASESRGKFFAVYHRQELQNDDGETIGYNLMRVYLSQKLRENERIKVKLPRGADPADYVVLVDKIKELKEVLQQDAEGNFVDVDTSKVHLDIEPLETEPFDEDDDQYFKKIIDARGDTDRYEQLQDELNAQAKKFSREQAQE